MLAFARLLFLLFLILKSSYLQTVICEYIASNLSNKLKCNVKIEKFDFSLPNILVLENFYLSDRNKDTLLFVNKLDLQVNSISFDKNLIEFNKLSLNNAYVKLFLDSANKMNYSFIIDEFISNDTTSTSWGFKIKNIELVNSKFAYKKYDFKDEQNGINYKNILAERINLSISDICYNNYSVSLVINNLSAKEQCGLMLSHFNSSVLIDTNGLFLKNVTIVTSKSNLQCENLNFEMKSIDDLDDFENKVKISLEIKKSLINFSDIAYFSSELNGLNEKIIFQGKIKGKISDIKAKNVMIEYLDNTFISGNFELNGLPDINQTFMTFNFKELETTTDDLSKIPVQPFSSNNKLQLSKEVKNFGKIYYKGEVTGFVNDFVAYGDFKTSVGNIKSDMSLKAEQNTGFTKFSGNLVTENFDLSKIMDNNKNIGKISLKSRIEGRFKDNNIAANIKGLINSFEFKNYNYTNIEMEGDLTQNTFEGSFNVNDANVKLGFLGKIDFSSKIPVFDFTADVSKLNFYKLNLTKFDSLANVSFLLSSRIKGNDIDNLEGKLELFNIKYKSSKIDESIGNLTLVSEKSETNNKLQLNSELVDITINGNYYFDNILQCLSKSISKYVPSLQFNFEEKKSLHHDHDNNIDLYVNFRNLNTILKEFVPLLNIENNTKLNFTYNSVSNDINLKIYDGNISYSDYVLNKPEIKIFTENNNLKYSVISKKCKLLDNVNLRNLEINGETFDNKGQLNVVWNNPDTVIYKGNLSFFYTLVKSVNKSYPYLFVEANPSMIVLSNSEWYLNDAKAEIYDSLININQLTLNNENQYLYANGKITNNPNDTIKIILNQLNLVNSRLFTKKYGLELDGLLNGNIFLTELLNKPKVLSNFVIENLKINNEEIGDLTLVSKWDNSSNNILISGNTLREGFKMLDFNGKYYTNGNIDFGVDINKLKLSIAEPYLKDIFSNIKGDADGNLNIKGTLSKPLVEGKININNTSFVIPYLKTNYTLNSNIDVLNNSFSIKNSDLTDADGNKAVVSGNVSHNNFNDINFDIGIKTSKLQMINTTEKDNELFYGKAYASGVVDISGPINNIGINVTAKTEKNSKIYIPLNSGSEVNQQNFVHFKSNKTDTVKINKEQNVNLSGLNIDLNIQATPDADVQIIFDSKVGDIIKGNGNGNLRLTVSPSSEFKMYGDYTIERGEYLFTLQNVINKKFEINKGGTITWNGDPYKALLDISAVYKLKASLFDLMLDSAYKQRVPVECVLNMSNNLLKPDIKFDIKLPDGDSKPNNLINSLSNEDINKQVISLLVLNRFVTPEIYRNNLQTTETKSSNAVGANSSELLSNQLSNWLSQISKNVDIGVNYRPGDELTHDELELALSTQILNDRVALNGNFGVGGNQTNQSSNFIGDFEVDVKINKSGKLMVKGFNRSNTSIINDTSPYTQGLGIFYKEDFDTFGKLLHQYFKSAVIRKKDENIQNPN